MGARRQKTTRSAAVFCRLAEQSIFPDSSRQRRSNEPLTRGNGLAVVEIGEVLFISSILRPIMGGFTCERAHTDAYYIYNR